MELAEQLDGRIQRARAGDPRATREIFEQHWDACVRAAHRRLGDVDMAEDAAQEAMVEALTRLRQLRIPEAFPSWLNRIVRGTSRTVKQRQQRELPVDPQVAADLADTAPHHHEELARAQDRAVVHTALRALSEPLRGVVRMFYLDDLKMRQICSALQLPLTTVKKRLHDARHQLHSLLISRDEATERIRGSDMPWAAVLEEALVCIDETRAVQTAYREAFYRGDIHALEELAADDYVHHPYPGVMLGKLGMFRAARRLRDEGVGAGIRTADRVVESDRVATWELNYPGHDCFIIRVANGKVVETFDVTNYNRPR